MLWRRASGVDPRASPGGRLGIAPHTLSASLVGVRLRQRVALIQRPRDIQCGHP